MRKCFFWLPPKYHRASYCTNTTLCNGPKQQVVGSESFLEVLEEGRMLKALVIKVSKLLSASIRSRTELGSKSSTFLQTIVSDHYFCKFCKLSFQTIYFANCRSLKSKKVLCDCRLSDVSMI